MTIIDTKREVTERIENAIEEILADYENSSISLDGTTIRVNAFIDIKMKDVLNEIAAKRLRPHND